MTETLITKYDNFDPRNIIYKDPVKLFDNIFLANLETSGNSRLLFQTPVMKVFQDPKLDLNNNNCNLDLQFSVDDRDFYEFIEQIDDYNKDFIYQNSENWFQNKFSKKSIAEFYNSCINKYYQPDSNSDIEISYITIDIPVVDNEVDINIYDSNKNLLDINNLKKDMYICCILELKGLKFLKKELVANWNIVQIKVEQDNINLTNYLINNQIETPNFTKFGQYDDQVIDSEIVEQLASFTPQNEYEDYDNACEKKSPLISLDKQAMENIFRENHVKIESQIPPNTPENSIRDKESQKDDSVSNISDIQENSEDYRELNFLDHNNKIEKQKELMLKKNQLKELLSEMKKANDYVESISVDVKNRYNEIESISRAL